MGSPLTMVRESTEDAGGQLARRRRGRTKRDDIYRQIKKSREKLSVTGARPRAGFNST